LREAFRAVDKNNTGLLTMKEIKDVFKESGGITNENLEEIFKNLDLDKDGKINYSEFLAATFDRKKALTMQNLQFAFHHFDVENSGFITEGSLTEVFHREGRKMTQQ
jgi:calcium-dependent protein kinase